MTTATATAAETPERMLAKAGIRGRRCATAHEAASGPAVQAARSPGAALIGWQGDGSRGS
ncbi:hypothetical protein HUT19_04165 [Streptomyces sp. NA02950]|uniref:hypothetical protein n=1 Tax=Streptomyces sp. NA02950 TaxID=2742137 RepID=UPI001591C007|nr:hypothetical protein [Streptomyces sp. NA02950]QKV91033.1 hypothetical protein HUT19_04165 [Streptomyces sp. NA02950]